VPLVTHLHGAHVSEESDGYPTAWTLPNADNIPQGYAEVGSLYEKYKKDFARKYGVKWEDGSSVYQYPNDQRATTLWYHDHAMGMTRTTVYSGLAGFYLLRGGPSDLSQGLPAGKYEIPLLIQDRSFNQDGSLFYPDNRAFFEGLDKSQLKIPFQSDKTIDGGASDIAPIWNPEFFGNTMVVNGQTWPYQNVEQKSYRFRLLNGSDSRTMMLKMSNDMPFWVIGADGGFLAAPAKVSTLLMGPAERADVIVDFSGLKTGTKIILQNIGPDSPFGGGQPGVDFPAFNLATTGQVM
jgi:bilirubin oxidase